MSIERLRYCLTDTAGGPEILNILDGVGTGESLSTPAPIKQWATRIITYGDANGEKLATLLEVITDIAPWEAQPAYYDAAQDIIHCLTKLRDTQALSTTAMKKFTESALEFSDYVPGRMAPVALIKTTKKVDKIYTTTVTGDNKETLKKLYIISTEWLKVAREKAGLAPDHNQEFAEYYAHQCWWLHADMSMDGELSEPGEACIVAYDKYKEVLGMMVYNAEKTDIGSLSKNPKYLPIQGNEEEIKGIGTALIRHIVQDMTENNQRKPITLEATEKSFGFYIKLGFEINQEEYKYGLDARLEPMILRVNKMDDFLQVHANTGETRKKDLVLMTTLDENFQNQEEHVLDPTPSIPLANESEEALAEIVELCEEGRMAAAWEIQETITDKYCQARALQTIAKQFCATGKRCYKRRAFIYARGVANQIPDEYSELRATVLSSIPT